MSFFKGVVIFAAGAVSVVGAMVWTDTTMVDEFKREIYARKAEVMASEDAEEKRNTLLKYAEERFKHYTDRVNLRSSYQDLKTVFSDFVGTL